MAFFPTIGGTTSTTTTTTNPKSISVDCLEGLTIEAIYINNQSDLTKLGSEYQKPSCYNIGQNNSNKAFFGVKINTVFAAPGRLNNNNGSGGVVYNGYAGCEDYKNIVSVWDPATKSRYDRTVISKSKALEIYNATPDAQKFIRFNFEPAVSSGLICDGSSTPNLNAAWFRISTPSGNVLYNGCFTTGNIDLYTCPLCLIIEHRTRINPVENEQRIATAIQLGLYNNKPYYQIFDDTKNYKILGYILWRNNRWEFHEKFIVSTGAVSGNFYGYNNSSLSLNYPIEAGTWVATVLSPATNIKRIVSGDTGDKCLLPFFDKCNCSGKIINLADEEAREAALKEAMEKLRKIQEDKC